MGFSEFEVIIKIIGGIGATFAVTDRLIGYSRKLYQLAKRKRQRKLMPLPTSSALKKSYFTLYFSVSDSSAERIYAF